MLKMVEMKRDDTRNLLANIQLFEGLTSAQLEWVAQRAHRRVFPAGTNVLTIEQPGEAVYIILHCRFWGQAICWVR
jgi:CRP/FNR family cyclic AMP-dependent transcriptional regulator